MIPYEFTKGGISLSVGEAQKLMLARLFTDTFSMSNFDELSSNFNPLFEVKLIQNIFEIFKHRDNNQNLSPTFNGEGF